MCGSSMDMQPVLGNSDYWEPERKKQIKMDGWMCACVYVCCWMTKIVHFLGNNWGTCESIKSVSKNSSHTLQPLKHKHWPRLGVNVSLNPKALQRTEWCNCIFFSPFPSTRVNSQLEVSSSKVQHYMQCCKWVLGYN